MSLNMTKTVKMSSLDMVKTAKILSEGLKDLHHELSADLEAAGKKEDFEEARQILITQLNGTPTTDDVLAFADDIKRLVYGTPELKARLVEKIDDGDILAGYNDITEEKGDQLKAQDEQIMKAAAGIKQKLVELVDESQPQPDNPRSRFERLLARLRGRKNDD